MTTTEKKPRVQKPPAEVVGGLGDVMQMKKCEDGRSLFMHKVSGTEMYILAASELQAWKAMHSHLGTMQKMTLGKLSERYKQEILKLREERNCESQETEAEE